MAPEPDQDETGQEERRGLQKQAASAGRKARQRQVELAALKRLQKTTRQAAGVAGKVAGTAGGKVAAKAAGAPVQVGEKVLIGTGVGVPVAAAIMAARRVAEKGISETTGQIAKQAAKQMSKAALKPLIIAQKRRVKKAQQEKEEADRELASIEEGGGITDIVGGKIRKLAEKFVRMQIAVAAGLFTSYIAIFLLLALGITIIMSLMLIA